MSFQVFDKSVPSIIFLKKYKVLTVERLNTTES